MADCHDLFLDFYDKIKLSSSKEEYLRSARDALRDRIKNYFKNTRKEKIPEFFVQGSYAMKTIINPLGGEFDIDDGVYLQNLDKDKSNWPSPEIVHYWIYKAVEEHTDDPPVDKRTCVRVIYSGDYHVDLPIYCIYNDELILAEKGEAGWHVSDAKAIVDWFKNEVKDKNEQLRRIVRYLKAWADNKSKLGKLPSGFVLTVLAVNNYEESDRDDGAFAGMIRNMQSHLSSSVTILNPVDSSEHLDDHITESQMKNFKERLSTLLTNASAALKENSKEKACKIWKKEFGDRFLKCEGLEENNIPLETSSPAILSDDERSANNVT